MRTRARTGTCLTTALCAAALVLMCTVTVSAKVPVSPRKAGAAKRHKGADMRPTVAVLYFDYTGKDAEMAVLRKGLAQMMISDLSTVEAVRMVERDRLQEVIAELKLQKSSRVDKKTAARIGKLLGARYMVLGGYFLLLGSFRVDARVVEVETGKIVRSFGVHGKQQDFIDLQQDLSAKLANVLRSSLPKLKARSAKRSHSKARRRRAARPPKKLSAREALQYAKALHAKDSGNLKLAAATLKKVVEKRPDFQLAQLDLASMAQ